MPLRAPMALVLAAAALAAGCSSSKHTAAPSGPLKLGSPAFADGQLIPIQYTCAESNVSPPLAWTAPPSGTVEEAVVMDDLDANYVHWVISGIKPTVTALATAEVPANAVVSRGSNGAASYFGPCPPQGSVHRYRVTIYALSKHVSLTKDTPAAQAVTTLSSSASAQASITGRFGR